MTIYRLFDTGYLHLDPETPDIFSSPQTSDLSQIVHYVREAQLVLSTIPVDDILALFAKLHKEWSKPESRAQRHFGHLGINYLLFWMRESHLRKVVALSLRAPIKVLDEPTDLKMPGLNISLLAQPRGVVCQWLAGNVPILGMISLLQSIITKNANIIKVPRENGTMIPMLVDDFRRVDSGNGPGNSTGRAIANSISAIYFDRENIQAQNQLSESANVRIAWGGADAVESVMNLPQKYGSQDIIFGPRTSFLVIGKEQVTDEASANRIASSCARDISLLEQKGCNSPHTLFYERGTAVSPHQFALLLAKELKAFYRKNPKDSVTAAEASNILRLRARYAMTAQAFHPKEIHWTVLLDEQEEGLAEPAFQRTIFIRPIDDIYQIGQYCSHLTQSAGLAIGESRRKKFIKFLSQKGVDRFPKVGAMTQHEIPWDGIFTMDRLVRWIKL